MDGTLATWRAGVKSGPIARFGGTGQAVDVARVLRVPALDPLAGQSGEGGQGEDVEPVVLEHAGHGPAVAPPHEVEVDARDLLAGHVAAPDDAEQRALQRLQPARLEARLPEPARGMEKVEVPFTFKVPLPV